MLPLLTELWEIIRYWLTERSGTYKYFVDGNGGSDGDYNDMNEEVDGKIL